jgi:hypothetical protein
VESRPTIISASDHARPDAPYDTAVINCLYSVPRSDHVPLVEALLSTASSLTHGPINSDSSLLLGRTKVPDLGRSAVQAAPLQAYSHCLVRTDVRLDPISSTN